MSPVNEEQEEALNRLSKIVNSLLARNDCAPFREPVDWRGLELYDYPQIITKMMDLGTIKRKLERNQYNTAHQCALDVKLVWQNCMKYNADGSDFWLLAKSYARRFEDRYRKLRQEMDVGEALGPDGTGTPAASTPKSSASNTRSSSGSKSKSKDSDKASEKSSSAAAAAAAEERAVTTTTRSTSPTPTSASSPGGGSTAGGGPPPNLDVRARLGANLFQLNGMQLGYVMTILEIECPHVLESWNTPYVDDNYDSHADHHHNNNNGSTNGNSNAGGGENSSNENNNSSNGAGGADEPPTSIHDPSSEYHYPDKIEINIDEIPLKVFTKINNYVNNQIHGITTAVATAPGDDDDDEDDEDGGGRDPLSKMYPDLDIYGVDESINGGTTTNTNKTTSSGSGSKSRKKARKS